ncbi:DUF1294 domain-containing protein [Alkalicoccus chagannorensis]|uniref:DUF1294 domain-containing protein n=1 Tax=Alkalicoccus chagannorensis TaxID=427072 RepID=UPI00040B4E06|nr:DUF1294 domain-containing protein [Alkalicoccus chagannorensis]
MWILYWLAVVNGTAGIFFFLDKKRAVSGGRRVRERTLLLLAAAGGAPAEWILANMIRHKTKKASFRLLLPLLTLVWAAAVWYIWQ